MSNLREPTSEMQGVLGVSSKAFGEVADLAAFSPNEVSLFLIDGLEAELRSVGAFKDLLEVRRRAEADYASAFKTQDTLQFKERQLREKGHAEKVQAIATKVAEAVSVTQRMNERLQDITKGIINCEAGKELRGRVNRIRSVLGQFAALGIASGERAQQVWTTFLTDSALDQGTMVSKAQATLTGNPSVTFEDGGLPSQSHLGDAEAAGGAGGAAAVMGGAGGAEAAAPASEEVTEL